MGADEPLTAVVTQAQGGDAAAWGLLVERFQDAAVGMAVGLSGDWSAAEDLAQDAFGLAYQHLGELEHPQAFAGWFLTLVRTA